MKLRFFPMNRSTLYLFAILLLAGCKTQKEKEAYEEKRKALVAEQDAKDAAEKAKHDADEAALRSACKSKTVKLPSSSDVVSICREEVRKQSLHPDSVSFPGLFDPQPPPVVNGCMMVYLSWADVKNAFGQKIRKNYRCEYDPKREWVTVKL